MKLVVTIDTEEDNWGSYDTKDCTVRNIEAIPTLQQMFDEFNIWPTYLVSYPVAASEKAVSILRRILEAGRCEVGSHCHPWNTPPFEEEVGEKNSMLCNLTGELQFRKIRSLHETIVKNFGVVPSSFRAGRWGYNRATAEALEKLGYGVDSSILSLTDWTAYHGPDYSNVFPDAYYFSASNDILAPHPAGGMLELPATVGFVQSHFGRSNALFNFLRKRPFNRLRLLSILERLGLLNRVALSPELSSDREMIALTKRLLQKRFPLINLFFHSPTLCPGLSPFVKTEADQREFMARLRRFLVFAKEAGIESIRLSDAPKEVPSC
jgi:hypothetical protein